MTEQAWRPRPCHTQTGDPGRPGFHSALTMKGRGLRAAGTVRMKGGESRPDHGDENPRFGPDKHGPGVEDATVERRRAACLAKARGHLHQGARLRWCATSALRSLTCVRGRETTAVPTPTK